MTVFLLSDSLRFPPAYLAEENGLLAIGGDLSEKRLVEAYKLGIFPWYANDDPILWWSPKHRFVLYPDDFRIWRSLKKTLKKNRFNITFDTDFSGVIRSCAAVNTKKHLDTWIVQDMITAYERLFAAGYAHSVEAWNDAGLLVGGLYGVSMGKCFFGESMFTLENDASKVAFAVLVRFLKQEKFQMIDCQLKTDHLSRFGAVEVHRKIFLKKLNKAISVKSLPGKWTFDLHTMYPEVGTAFALQ